MCPRPDRTGDSARSRPGAPERGSGTWSFSLRSDAAVQRGAQPSDVRKVPEEDREAVGAHTCEVVTADAGTAKRGLSTAIATVLARSHVVTVLDIDVAERDVGRRIRASASTFGEVSRVLHDDPNADMVALVDRDDHSRCRVVTVGSGLERVTPDAYQRVSGALVRLVDALTGDRLDG